VSSIAAAAAAESSTAPVLPVGALNAFECALPPLPLGTAAAVVVVLADDDEDASGEMVPAVVAVACVACMCAPGVVGPTAGASAVSPLAVAIEGGAAAPAVAVAAAREENDISAVCCASVSETRLGGPDGGNI
jgi:hypothetical protein